MKTKSLQRIENKKKKMAALLEISHLNEHDRKKLKEKQEDSEPSVKKARTENCHEVDIELGPSGKPKLSGLEYQELKKKLREKANKLKQRPILRLREMGVGASLSTDLENRVPLFISDIQHLIMYSQLGHHSPYSPARWCGLEKFNNLSTTCVLIIENLTMYHFMAHEKQFPFISSVFDFKLEVLGQSLRNSDMVREISMVPLTGTQVRKYCEQFGSLEEAVLKTSEVFDTLRNLFPIEYDAAKNSAKDNLPNSDHFPRTQLLLSGWQMVEENYPLPIKGLMETKFKGYVLTKDKYEQVTPFSRMFGLDCEMCLTSIRDNELTRVSVVDEDLNVFYDTLVKPRNRIVDYLTRFSGITAKMMRNVTKTLEDVQQDLRRLLPSDAILVGQSLGNDLHALKMMHPYCIDSGVIFNLTGNRTRKTKLKTLTEEFLNETIQDGPNGHCSTEDSSAALKLVQLKLTKSLYFGDAVMGNVYNDIKAYPELGTFNYATSILRRTTIVDKTARVVGHDDLVPKYKYYVDKGLDVAQTNEKIQYASEGSVENVLRTLGTGLDKFTLNIGHVRLDKEDAKMFKNIDNWVKDLYEKVPPNGLVMVVLSGTVESNGLCFIKVKQEEV